MGDYTTGLVERLPANRAIASQFCWMQLLSKAPNYHPFNDMRDMGSLIRQVDSITLRQNVSCCGIAALALRIDIQIWSRTTAFAFSNKWLCTLPAILLRLVNIRYRTSRYDRHNNFLVLLSKPTSIDGFPQAHRSFGCPRFSHLTVHFRQDGNRDHA